MDDILTLARTRNIPVIEDCAQAFLARVGEQCVGTFGVLGCFSLQQGKHITTGEGGFIVSSDEALARRSFLFINKAWGYGDPQPDHYFIAPNYRMSELQGAVMVAQLPKLEGVVAHRIRLADMLTTQIGDVPGLQPPLVHAKHVHTYWKYCLTIDSRIISGGAVALAKLLKERGIASAPRYIQKPAFQCEVFQKQRTFGESRWPFTLARPEAVDYSPERFPGVFSGLENILVLPWNERYTDEHVDYIATALRDAVGRLM
jgi:dTDP-4-amino-4,6-dideoxygalactose transaminase